jgi:adenylate kinase
MKESYVKYMKASVFVIVAMYAVIISGGPGIAGDYTMQKNLTDIADLMSKWSQQLSTGKLDATTQEKLGAIMSQTSGVLRDMTMQGQDDMQMDHHNKIMEMEKEWDPFDTSDKM